MLASRYLLKGFAGRLVDSLALNLNFLLSGKVGQGWSRASWTFPVAERTFAHVLFMCALLSLAIMAD